METGQICPGCLFKATHGSSASGVCLSDTC